MASLTAPPLRVLQLVTEIAHLVSHGHRGIHRSRTAGHIGTGNTLLVAHSAQRSHGKHRISR